MSYSKIKKIRLGKYDIKASLLVRQLRPACEYCGRKEFLAAHTSKGRACKATRFMLDNLVVLCPAHHTFNHQFSAHRTPEAFSRWFKKTFPDRYRNVIKKAQVMMSEREAIQEFTSSEDGH